MSVPMPSRQLGQRGLSFAASRLRLRSTQRLPVVPVSAAACRSLSNPFRPGNKKTKEQKELDALSNPILDEYLAQKKREEKAASKTGKSQSRVNPTEGSLSLSKTSLFLPERELLGWSKNLTPQDQRRIRRQDKQRRKQLEEKQDMRLSDMTLDPDPRARRRLQRKLVIAGVKRHGRMTKAQTIMRTERQSLYSSHFLATSVKKLQKATNQLAGKSISEALVQLRFSKKKVARDVIKGLEIAQNEAIVARGMGLGSQSKGKGRRLRQRESANVKAVIKPRTIELKDGSRKVIRDPTEIYIDQSWVGRGPSTKSAEFRARGQVNYLTHRTTSFSFLLKEEKTRMRISEEIKKKRDKRKLWVALPDRPVTSQRQYCLW